MERSKPYAYFLRRGLDLLAPGGIGVFLIPYGFLTGKSAAMVALRERVLKRHHLMAAFRLPSRLFPGANLVTDLLFFRARGGELPSVLPDDLPVALGKYFEQFPAHILGTERGTAEDEDDTTRKPRRGYEVDGEFTALPELVERAMCTTCAVTPFYTAVERPRTKPSRTEELPAHVQSAMSLGERVAHYLALLAREEEASTRVAAALYPELREALLAWCTARGAEEGKPGPVSPHADRALLREAKQRAELVSFLSAFAEDGTLVPALQAAPVYSPRFQGRPDDVAAQADFLYRTKRRLTLEMLRGFRTELGIADLQEPLHTALIAADWCFDEGEWHPARGYYTGSLWPKYDRAKALADQGDAQAAVQAALLLAAIRPARFADIAPEPRMPWVPLDIIRAWLEEWTDAAVPPLAATTGSCAWKSRRTRISRTSLGSGSRWRSGISTTTSRCSRRRRASEWIRRRVRRRALRRRSAARASSTASARAEASSTSWAYGPSSSRSSRTRTTASSAATSRRTTATPSS
ncbi:MAG: hypothetical protein U1A78_33530 [Polyangia bacterium]